jgi:hypothetical protein
MELLLSACFTYDKKIVLPGKQKRAVYASELDLDTYNTNYKTYCVDTNFVGNMANATDINRTGH